MSKEKANEKISSRVAIPEKKKMPTAFLFISALVVICVLVGVILFLKSGSQENDPKNVNQVVKPDNVEKVIAQLEEEEYTPVGSYEVTMNTDWTFPDGSSASTNAYVANSVNNRNTVYFIIALDNEAKDELYHSPYMEVGSHLENIQLDKVLEAGTYETVLTYYLVDDDFKEESQVSVSVTITIEK